MKSRLACRESITDLWGYPDEPVPRRPETRELFRAIVREAEMCLHKADWEDRIHRIENILSVIKWRISTHREACHETELDRLVKKAKEVNSHVG